MKVLLTGANGQLGQMMSAAAPTWAQVTACDSKGLDIADAAAVERQIDAIAPRVVVNCAAYTAVDRAETDEAQAFAVNRDGPAHLAAAARRIGARLVHVSTDFVFDGTHCRPYRPEDPPQPLGVYGRSKLAGERAVLTSASDTVVVRTAWVYSAVGNNFVKTMLRLMRERPQLRVVGDQVGTPTSALSLARALWRMIELKIAPGVYHYTDAGVASWYDFAVAIREITQQLTGEALAPVSSIRTEDYPTPAQRPAYSVLDKTSTIDAIGELRHWREPLAEVLAQLHPRT